MIRRPPRSTLFPYTTLFRSPDPLPAFARLVGAAYPGEELDAEVGPVVDEALAEALEPGWFRDRIAARLAARRDRKSTRLNSSHLVISYAVFCLKKKKITVHNPSLPDSYTRHRPTRALAKPVQLPR